LRRWFDRLGLLMKPFSMTNGGYMIIKKKGKVTEVVWIQGKGEAPGGALLLAMAC
jgi:hypothetical protein